MPQTGDGIADKKEKEKRKTVTVVRRTMPERGRYGGFCLSTPLHAPRSPSTYTAVDVQQYVSYSSTCVGTGKHSAGISIFVTIIRHPGERRIRPRESLSTPPARRVGHGRPLFRRGLIGLLCGVGVESPRPREAEWSSGLPAVFWVCYK